MSLEIGSPAWYGFLLVLGLAIGFAIGWVRKIRSDD